MLAKAVVPSFKWKEKRQQLLEQYAVNKGERLVIDSDITFGSPSTASMFVLGRPSNGWSDWKDKYGQTLDSVYRKQLD